ncbi:MAG: alpha/beta fold hydrolase [Actinomycetales bacterium]|nr:alpha/beta fold hydrolase [Actinomycetales bacterium]
MSAPALVPPPGLPGLDAAWSRFVDVPGRGTFHVLERPSVGAPELTVIAVHGNPTWSYLWRRLLAQAPPAWRVIAIDHLGMGYSERTSGVRRLAERIDDLDALTAAMEVDGPVVTVAHDWGGPISLGWALRHRPQLRGIVLTNTAVHQPPRAPAPTLIRLARLRPVLRTLTERTPGFVRGTTWLSRGMPADVIDAYRAPYRDAASRRAIGDFVADIPLESTHPSAATLDSIADDVRALTDVPVFIAWGSDDPVFSDRYLRDLVTRMPHADVHRYEKARHLVTEDAPACVGDIIEWIAHLSEPLRETDRAAATADSMDALLMSRGNDTSVAIADLRSGLRVSWSVLAARTREIAAGLRDLGVAPGDRVAMLVPPGPDLVAAVYATWRIGAIVVVADSGLGVRGMRRALRSAEPQHVIGIPAGLGLARTLGLPGRRILVGRTGPATRILAADATLSEVARRGRALASPDSELPAPDDDALVVFTSGATGPAKGVVYTHRRLWALRDALRDAYDIHHDGERPDALVAAFAPWAVLGPALGIASAIPDMEITDASSLTADTTAAAVRAVGGTLMWTSPTALRAIVSTADHLTAAGRIDLEGLRLVLAAGAPVPPELLDQAAQLMPKAEFATPYGMTEALPLTEVTIDELRTAQGAGVLVGRALSGVDIAIAPLGADAAPANDLVTAPDITGEIVVRSAWMRDRYDRRWATQRRADTPAGWHRTGDVGHLDSEGRLWVEGRLAHVLVTADGPVTPVAAELAAQRCADTSLAALVGIGPAGTQVPVIVLLAPGPAMGLADVELTGRVRAAVAQATGLELAAVLTMRSLPVDVRHRSKIDRTRIAREASSFLAGEGDDG